MTGLHPRAATSNPTTDSLVSSAPSSPEIPLGTVPRRTACHARDGRSWELTVDSSGVAVATATATATVAEAHVWERDGVVTIEFWVDGADLPDDLGAQLVAHAFAHSRVRSRQPVLLCIPRRNGALLQHVLGHIEDPRTRAAGMTCLVEGRVRSAPVVVPHPRSA